jgi:hypothetical protein
MKKFSEVNNQSVKTPETKKDYIKYLIDESIKLENGEIIGKDTLAKVFETILKMNDHKTTISILENVKALSKHHLNLQWINEAIENEKKKMDCKDEECKENDSDEEEDDDEGKKEKEDCKKDKKVNEDSLNESVESDDVVSEAKKDEDAEEETEESDCKCKCKCKDDCKDCKCDCDCDDCKCKKDKKTKKDDDKIVECFDDRVVISEDRFASEINTIAELYKNIK